MNGFESHLPPFPPIADLCEALRVEFNTNVFEASHGRAPRGRGSWAFAETRHAEGAAIIWASGTYAEAKRQAIAKVKAMGVRGEIELFVLS